LHTATIATKADEKKAKTECLSNRIFSSLPKQTADIVTAKQDSVNGRTEDEKPPRKATAGKQRTPNS